MYTVSNIGINRPSCKAQDVDKILKVHLDRAVCFIEKRAIGQIREAKTEKLFLQTFILYHKLVVDDEKAARKQFLSRKEKLNAHQSEAEQKCLCEASSDSENWKVISPIYEDKIPGKIHADVYTKFLEKYQSEQKILSA